MEENVKKQVEEAYREMVKVARCRPAVVDPQDDQVSREELDLYADQWRKEEHREEFRVGCPSMEGRKALIWTIEAARLICAMRYEPAVALLEHAAKEAQDLLAERRRKGLPEI